MNRIKEKRLTGRYPTFCVVELDSGMGVTRNLSTSGVCFTTEEVLEVGSTLRCFILKQKKGGIIRRLRCEGLVIRAEKIAEGWEVGISFSTFEW